MATVVDDLKRLAAAPATFVDHVQYGDLAQLLVDRIAAQDRFRPRESDAPYRVWGSDRAWAQLGTSGNHFVEFGELVVTDAGVGLQPGR